MLCKASNCGYAQAGKLFDCKLPIDSETIGESGKCLEFRKKYEQRIVYICTPHASSGTFKDNKIRTQKMCKKALDEGCAPIAPHLSYPEILEDAVDSQRAIGLKAAMLLLSCCDEIWLIALAPIKGGMLLEVEEAVRLGIPMKKIEIN